MKSIRHGSRFGSRVFDRTLHWTSSNYLTYLLLFPRISPAEILGKASEIMVSHRKKSPTFHIQQLLDIHFQSNLRGELYESGTIRYLSIYSIVGVIILLLACRLSGLSLLKEKNSNPNICPDQPMDSLRYE